MTLNCTVFYRGGGGEIRGKKRSNIGVKRFLRFLKNGQFPDMRSSGGKTIKHVKNTKLCPTKNLSENVLRRCESMPDGLSTCKNMFRALF